ncbi:MAG: crossover junction endodeoxyribonuclease RuvC [Gammaproteobacteria bacterium]|nr:crossover junction endodeoxyribonuclease RuvC [Gammaproteobacteria bacterium]
MKSGPVRILGIDPGSRVTGYGIIDFERSQARCVSAGSLVLGDGELGERLLRIHTRLGAIIQTYAPTEVVLEQVFMHRNARSALVLGQARGAAVVAALGQGLRMYEYAPNRIKQAVTGRGHAGKEQVQHMVRMLLNLDEMPGADAADALAAAICHAHIRQTDVNQSDALEAGATGKTGAADVGGAGLVSRRRHRRWSRA